MTYFAALKDFLQQDVKLSICAKQFCIQIAYPQSFTTTTLERVPLCTTGGSHREKRYESIIWKLTLLNVKQTLNLEHAV